MTDPSAEGDGIHARTRAWKHPGPSKKASAPPRQGFICSGKRLNRCINSNRRANALFSSILHAVVKSRLISWQRRKWIQPGNGRRNRPGCSGTDDEIPRAGESGWL